MSYRRIMKMISILMAAMLLTAMGGVALTEDMAVEPAAPLAEDLGGAAGLTVDDGQADVAPELPAEPETDTQVAVAAPALYQYVLVANDAAAVYLQDDEDYTPAALLNSGDVVLVTGAMAARTPVAFFADGKVLCGYMDASELLPMDDAQTRDYLNAVAASGQAGLYADDINWPLAPLAGVTYGDDRILLATTISNDKAYTMNGQSFTANQMGSANNGNCWKWCQALYKAVWGVNFTETFLGTDATGNNLLANLNDSQRTTTAAHVRAFIQQTVPGATIRVCACSTACKSFNNDGLGCGHKGHSMIVVEKTADGLTVMDNLGNHTRYYTWQDFANSWKSFTYIKYIKFPGATPLPANYVAADGSSVAVTGVSLNQSAFNLVVGQTATLSATVTPENASVKAVEWASSNTAVATVDNGVVVGKGSGTATIGVKTRDGDFTASCTVTVSQPALQKSLSKTGGNGTVTLNLGERLQLVPDFATRKLWTIKGVKSSKARYASVSAAGVVTALAVGKTTITVTCTNRKKATLTVKVVDPFAPTAVALNRKGTVKLHVGETLQLQAALKPSTANTTYTWKSSSKRVASVDANGLVTALKRGSCQVAVRTANGKYAKVKIKVLK